MYTVIQKSGLTIEYIKFQKQYEMPGYFEYKDILLDFNEPFFYDSERGLWLTELENVSKKEQPSDEEPENTEDCLTVDEGKKRSLGDFVVYEKGELATAIENFVKENSVI